MGSSNSSVTRSETVSDGSCDQSRHPGSKKHRKTIFLSNTVFETEMTDSSIFPPEITGGFRRLTDLYPL